MVSSDLVERIRRVQRAELAEKLEKDNLRHFPGFCSTTGNVIHPNSTFARAWTRCLFFAVVYCTVMIPWDFFFYTLQDLEKQGWHLGIAAAIDLFFTLDFILTFATAYHDIDTLKLVQTYPEIRAHYRHSANFWTDIPPAIPFTCIGFFSNPTLEPYEALKLFKCLRLAELFRASGLVKLIIDVQLSLRIKSPYVRIISTTAVLLYVAHLIACLWFHVFASEGFNGWMDEALPDGSLWDPDFSIRNASQDPLISNDGDDEDMFKAYQTSVYFTLTTLTTVGYGEITPVTNAERSVMIAVFIVGVLSFSYLTGSITSIISDLMAHERMMAMKLNDVTAYLQQRRTPKILYHQVLDHFQYNWSKTPMADESEMLRRLTPTLYEKMCEHLKKETLLYNPLFCNSGHAFMVDVLVLLMPVFKMAGEYITTAGEQAMDMHFLQRGRISVMDDQPGEEQQGNKAQGAFSEKSTVFVNRGGQVGSSTVGPWYGIDTAIPEGEYVIENKFLKGTCGEVVEVKVFGRKRSFKNPEIARYLYTLTAPLSFGEGGLFGGKRMATVVAADMCDLLSLSGMDFKECLDKLPDEGGLIKRTIALDRHTKSLTRRKARTSRRMSQAKSMDGMRNLLNCLHTAVKQKFEVYDEKQMRRLFRVVCAIQINWINKMLKRDALEKGRLLEESNIAGSIAKSLHQKTPQSVVKSSLTKIMSDKKAILETLVEERQMRTKQISLSTSKNESPQPKLSEPTSSSKDKIETLNGSLESLSKGTSRLEGKCTDVQAKVT